KAGDLVAPRRIKRVFRNGQQLNMREAQLLHIVNQRACDLPVTERLRHRLLPPGAEVNLVSTQGRTERILPEPFVEPGVVTPRELQDVPDDGGVLGRGFEEETKR